MMTETLGGSEAYTVKWLENSEVDSEDAPNDHEHETGFPAQLWTRCLAELRSHCSYREKEGVSKELNAPYWDELARLYLWGEHFEDGRLEVALRPSDELRVNVLELLSGIAKSLLTCQYP